MPLQRRLPKVGFSNPNRVVYQVVNLDEIARRELTGAVSLQVLKDAGLIGSLKKPVKVLGRGEISVAVQIQAHAFSASASEKIGRAGGSVEIISKDASKAEAE